MSLTQNLSNDTTLAYLLNGKSKSIKQTNERIDELAEQVGDVIYVGPDEPEDPKIKLWLDTDEQGASAVNSVNGKNGTVVLDAEDVGAISGDLLWENASPTSAFAAQTVALDLASYQVVMITFVANAPAQSGTTLLSKGSFILPVGEFGFFITYVKYGSSFFNYERQVTVNSNGIVFDLGYANAGNEQNNAYAVPLYIHGVKGVQTS